MSDNEPTLPPSDDREDPQTVLPASTQGAKKSARSPTGHPNFENYEILEELGRGGMGVVYKARDTKLDRNVALKMVLSGKFATEEELQRFQLESESAARLDHPGIVPIYETGQVNGNHFFSMKLVEGDSLLSRLDEYKSDHRSACELIAKIADAVHHAHQRAVLHRDLKPANILVDEEGQPAITDFGLAKRTDADRELTQTGLVMGTPGFMSPEQASGRKDVTAAADVFSLGAMLYWTITGEAPFQGASGMETVLKTIECDVPSVRTLVPNADFDLNLICMKAMHKEPDQRYTSAAAMAEDLRAWLEGEPISVRRASAVSLATTWIRKNLRTVLGAFLCGAICGVLMGAILGLGELSDLAKTEFAIQEMGDESSRTWVSNFLFLKDISRNWQWIHFLMVPAVAMCAILCVLLVRPKSREVNIAAGLTAGFVASAVALILAGGWGLIGQNSVDAGYRDIELLSTTMWLESDAERKLAQKAMLDRYPGLNEMDTGDRQTLVRRKIMHLQKTGLTPDLWWGLVAAALFVGLPLALTCILSGSLWQQGIRGGQWFGCTWERAAYLLIFFIILSVWFSPLRPATWLLIVGPLLLLVALGFAVRMSSMIWRIAMVPIPFLFMFLIQFDFQAMNGATWQAGKANDVELREQLLHADRRLAQVEDPLSSYRVAIGWLHLEEEQRYQEYCQKASSNFDYAWKPDVASRLAKLCLLRPDLQRAEDLKNVWELTEFASEFDSAENIQWFQATRALAELRRGNYELAHQWNQKSRSNEKTGNGYRHALTHAIDSLAWTELGDMEKARRSLENGQRLHTAGKEKAMSNGHDSTWHDSLVFRILEKEATKKLNR